jgi:hypothetical protein
MTTTIPLTGQDGKLSENGMLSPEGKFFPCESGYHDMTCEEILKTNRYCLEMEGWIFIINCQIFLDRPFDLGWCIPQAQWDFCKEYLEQYPDEMSMFWELRATRTKRK